MKGRITSNPNQFGGRPCIRGMRNRVKDAPDLQAAGVRHVEILEDHRYLNSEEIPACFECATAAADHSVLVAR